MTLRTDLAAARRRCAWYGARGWQLALLTVAESTVLALGGTLIGLALAVLVSAIAAERAGSPVGDVLVRSVLSWQGLRLAVLVAAVGTAILVAAATVRRAGTRFGLLDAAALAAAGLVALELARAAARRPRAAPAGADRSRPPCSSHACCRPALRLVERLSRGRSLGLRLASLSLARSPGYASWPQPSSSSASPWRSSPRATARRWRAGGATRRRTACRSTTSSARTCGA